MIYERSHGPGFFRQAARLGNTDCTPVVTWEPISADKDQDYPQCVQTSTDAIGKAVDQAMNHQTTGSDSRQRPSSKPSSRAWARSGPGRSR
ncbi:hypothetical protein GCM10009838_44710 [Catenulispora subtropica]|uniref:Uncharacterized protein n=1 Tax=Catenulispora subtropica TaxID=450798 RepID=A0ABP5DES3_9ACTN